MVAVTILPLSLSGVLSLQLRQDLGLTSEGLGIVFAVFFGSAALSSSWLGRVTERLGPGRSLRLGGAGIVVSSTAVATLVQTPTQLVVAIAAAGTSSALTRPAANLWIARAIPVGRQGLALGVNQSSVLVATLAAGIAVPALALPLGWRSAYLATAVLAVAAVLALPPDSTAWRSRPRSAAPAAAADLSHGRLVMLAITAGFATAGASCLGAFTLPTLVASGTREATAGLVIAASSVLGLLARIGVGHGADRRSAVGLVGTTIMIGLGALAFLLLATGSMPAVLVGVPLSFATAWGWLGLFNLAILRLNPVAPGAATGITQSGAFVGGVAGPFLMGVIAERLTYGAGWTFLAALAALSAVAMLVIDRTLRSR